MIFRAAGLQTHIWNNNFRSTLLLIGFPLLILAMMWTGGFLYFSTEPTFGNQASKLASTLVWQYWLYVLGGVMLWFTIAFFFHQNMIDAASGAKFAERKDHEKIYNLLENLCISRGVTMPKIAIIESPALNAFASGLTEKQYTITLTSGLISRLNDEELESVLGHELSHIINRDVRLLVISVIFVGILGFLAEAALRSRGGRGKKEGKVLIIAIIILTVGYLIAILMRFSLSRKREYLADACSVDMTKNPDAMISALQKISADSEVEGMPKDVAQMCIENSRPSFFGVFATHPPIKDRIHTLEMLAGGKKESSICELD